MEELLKTLVHTILSEKTEEEKAKALELLMSNSARALIEKVSENITEEQQAQLDLIEEDAITLSDVANIFGIDNIREKMTEAVVEQAGLFIDENAELVNDEKIQVIETLVSQLQA